MRAMRVAAAATNLSLGLSGLRLEAPRAWPTWVTVDVLGADEARQGENHRLACYNGCKCDAVAVGAHSGGDAARRYGNPTRS